MIFPNKWAYLATIFLYKAISIMQNNIDEPPKRSKRCQVGNYRWGKHHRTTVLEILVLLPFLCYYPWWMAGWFQTHIIPQLSHNYPLIPRIIPIVVPTSSHTSAMKYQHPQCKFRVFPTKKGVFWPLPGPCWGGCPSPKSRSPWPCRICLSPWQAWGRWGSLLWQWVNAILLANFLFVFFE